MHGLGAHVTETRRMAGIALDLCHPPVADLHEQAAAHAAVRAPGRPVVAVVGGLRWCHLSPPGQKNGAGLFTEASAPSLILPHVRPGRSPCVSAARMPGAGRETIVNLHRYLSPRDRV